MVQQPLPEPWGDMPPEEFRDHGERVVGWVADYLAGKETYGGRRRGTVGRA